MENEYTTKLDMLYSRAIGNKKQCKPKCDCKEGMIYHPSIASKPITEEAMSIINWVY